MHSIILDWQDVRSADDVGRCTPGPGVTPVPDFSDVASGSSDHD